MDYLWRRYWLPQAEHLGFVWDAFDQLISRWVGTGFVHFVSSVHVAASCVGCLVQLMLRLLVLTLMRLLDLLFLVLLSLSLVLWPSGKPAFPFAAGLYVDADVMCTIMMVGGSDSSTPRPPPPDV